MIRLNTRLSISTLLFVYGLYVVYFTKYIVLNIFHFCLFGSAASFTL